MYVFKDLCKNYNINMISVSLMAQIRFVRSEIPYQFLKGELQTDFIVTDSIPKTSDHFMKMRI